MPLHFHLFFQFSIRSSNLRPFTVRWFLAGARSLCAPPEVVLVLPASYTLLHLEVLVLAFHHPRHSTIALGGTYQLT
jgi:hypothetical protein